MRKFLIVIFAILISITSFGSKILVPMDGSQTNHLKAYGVSYFALKNDIVIEWLLNYRGGSFMYPHLQGLEEELLLRGIKYEIITDGQANAILNQISHPEQNMEVVQLEKAPKIAVYTPNGKQPWDDAVTLVLEYAEIPYDKIYRSAFARIGRRVALERNQI